MRLNSRFVHSLTCHYCKYRKLYLGGRFFAWWTPAEILPGGVLSLKYSFESHRHHIIGIASICMPTLTLSWCSFLKASEFIGFTSLIPFFFPASTVAPVLYPWRGGLWCVCRRKHRPPSFLSGNCLLYQETTSLSTEHSLAPIRSIIMRGCKLSHKCAFFEEMILRLNLNALRQGRSTRLTLNMVIG